MEAGEESSAIVELYDISTPTEPKKQKQWVKRTAHLTMLYSAPITLFLLSVVKAGKYFLANLMTHNQKSPTRAHKNFSTYTRSTMYMDPKENTLFICQGHEQTQP